MKLTPVVNFTNILRAAFLYLQNVFVIFRKRKFAKKAALKMLVKVTTEVDPKSPLAKKGLVKSTNVNLRTLSSQTSHQK